MERTSPSPLRRAVLGALALVVPGALLIAWAAIVFGGGIEALREQERRDAEAALATARTAVASSLRSIVEEPGPARLRIERDDDGALRGPFLEFDLRALEPEAPPPPAIQVALELEARGRHGEALRWLSTALASDTDAGGPVAHLALARLLAHHGAFDDALRTLAALRADAGDARWQGLPVATLATVLELKIAAEAGRPERAAGARTTLVSGAVPCPLPAVGAIARRIRQHTAPPFDDVDDWVRAAEAARSSTDPLPEGALAAGPDGAVLGSAGGAMVVLSPRDVATARDAARVAVEREHPGWTLAADAGLAEATPPFLSRPLSIAPSGTPGSARLQSAARVLALAAIAAFVIGNLLLFRVVRRELRLSRLRSSFIDLVSHELRTPLAALTVKAEMLASGDVPPAKVPGYQRDLFGAARRLGDLVQRVLDFARLEKARLPLEPRTVGARQLLASAVRAGRDALRLGGQRLDVRVPRALPDVRVDVEVMARALRNLLDNAARHAPHGSAIELQAGADGRTLRIVVADHGPGLRGATDDELFEPFRRGPTAKGDGSGLGLAIVRQAARAHGGGVRARDRDDGSGALFELWLPLAEDAA